MARRSRAHPHNKCSLGTIFVRMSGNEICIGLFCIGLLGIATSMGACDARWIALQEV